MCCAGCGKSCSSAGYIGQPHGTHECTVLHSLMPRVCYFCTSSLDGLCNVMQ